MVAPELHTASAPILNDQSFDHDVQLEPQIRAPQCRLQKSARGRPAAPTFLIDVEIGNPFVVAAIEVLDGG